MHRKGGALAVSAIRLRWTAQAGYEVSQSLTDAEVWHRKFQRPLQHKQQVSLFALIVSHARWQQTLKVLLMVGRIHYA